ncbi:MAG: DUF4054 domain-containing protein [Vagococcus fluvialis]
MTPIADIASVRAKYLEMIDVSDDIIQSALDDAAILVDDDVLGGTISESKRKMAESYMACHLLFLNFGKTAEDKWDGDTSDKKMLGKLGTGLNWSPYGQFYLTLKCKKDCSNAGPVSGLGFMS